MIEISEEILDDLYQNRTINIHNNICENENIIKNIRKEYKLYNKLNKKLKKNKLKIMLEELLDKICTNNEDFKEIYYKNGLKDGISLMLAIVKLK